MNHIGKTSNHKFYKHRKEFVVFSLKEQGSSTLEFIFCAPLLLIIMFVAMELNERIEQKVNTTITGGNLAWIAKADSNGSTAASVAKADILGSKISGATLGVGAGSSMNGNEAVMSYTDTKRRADSYAIHLEHLRNVQSDRRAKDRATQKIGNSTTDSFTTGLATAAITIGTVIDGITAPNVSWIPSLFLKKIGRAHV